MIRAVDSESKFLFQNSANPHLIGYTKFFSHSYDAVIGVYDDAGNVIETHEHEGDFKEW